MVMVDELDKVSHFTPVKNTRKDTNITSIYLKEVTILHGIPKEIISDRDSNLSSNFWKGLFKGSEQILI